MPNSRNQSDLGRTNRRAVLARVLLRGATSRTEIARETGLTTAAVSRITRDLIEAGLLTELPQEDLSEVAPRGPGRRYVDLDLRADGGFVLGIAVNVFSQSVTLADLKNQRLARKDLRLADLADPERVIARLLAEAKSMIAEEVEDRARLLGASFAFTGAVDPQEGVVRTSPYMRWGSVSLGPRLSHELGCPVVIENLPAALALAETRFGRAQGIKNLLTVNCSLGLAAAILMDGEVRRGHDFSAGLIGAMTPAGKGGGSLDERAAGHGLLKAIHGDELDIEQKPADQLADLLLAAVQKAKEGDEGIINALAHCGRQLGEALGTFTGLLQPEALMLAGPLASAPSYVEACREALASRVAGYKGELLISEMSPQAAARWVAISTFLMDHDLDLEGLKLNSAKSSQAA